MSLNAFLPFITIAAVARDGQKATFPVLLSTFVLMLLTAPAGYLSNPIHAHELLGIFKQHADHARYCAQTGQRGAQSVPAMLRMFDAPGTAPARKLAVAFDIGAHAIGSPHKTLLAGELAQTSIGFLRAGGRHGGCWRHARR